MSGSNGVAMSSLGTESLGDTEQDVAWIQSLQPRWPGATRGRPSVRGWRGAKRGTGAGLALAGWIPGQHQDPPVC